jgi:uncharacterized protein YdhG (YjbR/CyaY superfamily)
MAKTDFKSVGEYIATHPKDVQAILQRVRGTIRKAVPGAEEVISYQIPAYKVPGGPVLYFAGWKEHCSIYPATDGVLEAFKDELAPYKVTKGTIRFPLSQPIPVKLIERIAKFRAEQVAQRAKAKSAAPKKQIDSKLHPRAGGNRSMSLAKKLNLKDGMKVRVVGKPANVELDDVAVTTSAKAEALLIFVKTLADVDAKCAPLIEAAKADRIAWAAYPKAGQLGTDLNRDILWERLQKEGIETVRQIALDPIWSALRFRPAK